MSKVLVPLAEGFEEIEAVTVIDVLRRGGVEVFTASLTDSLKVRGAHGMELAADTTMSAAAADYEAIVLPGGPGTSRLLECEALCHLLARHREAGRLLAAICAAPTVLTKLGLVPEDAHLTCYPTCEPDLGRPSAGAPVVEDGRLITGQAPGSALLFALVVLKALEGAAAARRVAEGMVSDVLNF